MEEFLDATIKHQQEINDGLKNFSELLDELLWISEGKKINSRNQLKHREISNNALLQELASVFGLKVTSMDEEEASNETKIFVKPSFLFTTIPDISRTNSFQSFYTRYALSREFAFSKAFKKTATESVSSSSFAEVVRSLYFNRSNDGIDKNQFKSLQSLYDLCRISKKFDRKYKLEYDYYDSNILKNESPALFRANDPLDGENYIIHRIIVTRGLFVPYDFENCAVTAVKAFQIILHGHARLFNKPTSYLPLVYELEKAVESCQVKYCNLRSNVFPPPPLHDLPDDTTTSPSKDYSLDQIEWLCNEYLPNVFRHRVTWENSVLNRSELIYKLLSCMTRMPKNKRFSVEKSDARKEWSSVMLSQYPVLIKRNGQYMLIYGIRWKSCSSMNESANSMKKHGICGLEMNREHFNNYPYFNSNGTECIETKKPPNSLISMFKPELEATIISKGYRQEYMLPVFPPLRTWIFGSILSHNSISKTDFSGLMEGRKSILHVLLKYRPDIVVSEIINEKVTRLISSALTISKPKFSKIRYTIDDFKRLPVVKNDTPYLEWFLPFHCNVESVSLYRKERMLAWNTQRYLDGLFKHMAFLFNVSITEMSNLTLHEALELRDYLQSTSLEKEVENAKNVPNFSYQRPPLLTSSLKEDATLALLLFHPPSHDTTIQNIEQSRNTMLQLLPYIVECVRDNIHQMRKERFYFKLYLRGLFVPHNPLLHRDYIKHKVKKFLKSINKNLEEDIKENDATTLLRDNITLLSRFMNLKWKRPLSYVRIMTPSTRYVFKKIVDCFAIPIATQLHGQIISDEEQKQYQPPMLDRTTSIVKISHIDDSIIQAIKHLISEIPFSNLESEQMKVPTSLVGKYLSRNADEKQLAHLFLLFLVEYLLKTKQSKSKMDTTDLCKLALNFKLLSKGTQNIPDTPSLELGLIDIFKQTRVKMTETSNKTVKRIFQQQNFHTLRWRSKTTTNMIDIKTMLWNSFLEHKTDNFLIHPLTILIHPTEKTNLFIWKNMLEMSFDLQCYIQYRDRTSSFFPIKMSDEERNEWAVFKNEAESNTNLKEHFEKFYPFDISAPVNHRNLGSADSSQIFNCTTLLDMFLNTLDWCSSSSRLALLDSLSYLPLAKHDRYHHKQFGQLLPLIPTNEKDTFTADPTNTEIWDIYLMIQCFSKRIRRKLLQYRSQREIFGKSETVYNIPQDTALEISNLVSNILDLINKNITSFQRQDICRNIINEINNYQFNEKSKYHVLWDLVSKILKFCQDFEMERVFSKISDKVTSDTVHDLLNPKESTSKAPQSEFRRVLKDNELYSLSPFLDRDLEQSKTTQILDIDSSEHSVLRSKTLGKPKHKSFGHSFFKKAIKQSQQHNFEAIFGERFIDFAYILSYGHVRNTIPSYSDSLHTLYITEAEAAYMNEQERPLFYQAIDREWDNIQKPEPSDPLTIKCDSVEDLEQLADEGVDARMIFGGFAGGDCELLLCHPSSDIEAIIGQDKDVLQNQRIEFFGEMGCGWMNLNDIVGPGIQTIAPFTSDKTRPKVWLGTPLEGRFEYYPGLSLEENKTRFIHKSKAKKTLKYLTHPKTDMECDRHHLRDTIPLFNLEFLFFSSVPFNFKSFPSM
ncbi:hypothetical protein C9374_000579 [Naegleria lovaniensis]|uniref:Uncharacterized protein n=1 Tax=Naegleria lovaniensis TaxID=51637 RepID=A0AA88GT58_NAELO|nr:uncharacterized protein C9374_000579 [Naegleria lovaniensis]KAG2388415.1 hypothetical protein C9374_000579 [Naegleria lovaniensis]